MAMRFNRVVYMELSTWNWLYNLQSQRTHRYYLPTKFQRWQSIRFSNKSKLCINCIEIIANTTVLDYIGRLYSALFLFVRACVCVCACVRACVKFKS